MRNKQRILLIAEALFLIILMSTVATAQETTSKKIGSDGRLVEVKPEYTPPSTPRAAAAGDVKAVVFNWMWYLGMLRGYKEEDSVATFELWKSTGTVWVDGQPCNVMNYRASINYQVNGMRTQYTCTLPNGESRRKIEVVSGRYAWDEDQVGAEIVKGQGKATPVPNTVDERLIRLWSSPQGAAKAAAAGGDKTKVGMENGKPVVTFPIPGVSGATAKATLNAENQAERVEVRQGNSVTEFQYEKYADHNPEDDRVDGYFPGHIVEARNGKKVLDIDVKVTEVGNLYVIMPVPESIQRSEGGSK